MRDKTAIDAINDFFNEKIEKFIAAKFKELLSDIKKKDVLKITIESLGKQYDATEYNQWMKDKLIRLNSLLNGPDKPSPDALTIVNQALMYFEKTLDHIDLREKLKKELSKTKKSLQAKIEQDDVKATCMAILEEKLVRDSEKKTKEILTSLSETNPEILKTMQTIEHQAQQKYEITQWMDDASRKAEGVVLDVTHIAKLTHSSAKGSNINANDYNPASNKRILTTINCASTLPKDFAYVTAEYAPIAEFLQTDCEGELLGKLICEDASILGRFAKEDTQAVQWQEQFRLAFNEKQRSTHELLKQIFFPIYSGYHLLTPLISSSMAQIIHDRIWQTRQKNMAAREARNNNLFYNQIDTLFHKTAVLRTTQTNHQNVSYLNGKRVGQLTLLPALPPEWKKQHKPPTKAKTIFNKELWSLAKEPIEKLKRLLLAIKTKELSINLKRKRLIAEIILEIADVIFYRVSGIQGLSNEAGWSLKSKLPMHQQYWLDPFREDENFQINRVDIDWQKDITKDFAKWLNFNLKSPKLTLGISQERHWRKIFEPLLREFSAVVEASVKAREEIA